jgi:hypothetical protein
VQQDASGDTVASVEIHLPDVLEVGEHDFGSLRMKELPFVVQGYVVDDRDAAVPGARVGPRSTAWQSGTMMNDAAFSTEKGQGRDAGNPNLGWVAVSDSSGFFKLRGVLADGDIDLVCDAPDHVMMPLAQVKRGDKKVRIVMARFGTLLSKFVLPPGMPSDLVTMTVDSGGHSIPAKLDANAIVYLSRLPAGKIKVSIGVAGIAKPVLSLEDVEVKPGAEISDPRATQIDLRQRVFFRTLHVNDPDGKPVSFVTGRVVEMNDDHRPPRKIDGRDGVMTFVTMQPSVDVNVGAPGFVTQVLHDVDKDMDVTLERAPK